MLNKFTIKWCLSSYFSLPAKLLLIQSRIFAPIRAAPGRFDNIEQRPVKFDTEGEAHRNARLLLDNPSDMSTYLGYQDHHIHDMSSLVNEAKAHVHGQGGTGTGSSDIAHQGKSLSFAGTNLWRCDAHVVEVCDLNCLDVDPKDGCPFCVQSCRKLNRSCKVLHLFKSIHHLFIYSWYL